MHNILKMSQTKFDNITRSAIWSAYNNICFFCGRPLDWSDLHIDHLLPEFLTAVPNIFKQLLVDYELPPEFEINDITNLVPSHSRCNLRKSNELFNKKTTLYYFSITTRTKAKINAEIDKLKRRKNKGLLLSKLQSALVTNVINKEDIKNLLFEAEENDWNLTKIKLPIPLQFIDEVFESFYLNSDISSLFDKKIEIGGGPHNELELVNDKDEKILVETLNDWIKATKAGYFAYTTYAIKMSADFSFFEDLIHALKNAKMPKVSFLSEPWLEISDLEYLSAGVLHDFEDNIQEYANKGLSIAELVKLGVVKINESGNFNISIEFSGMETSFVEIFRADFNNDGVEDIFVRGWTRAIGGTLGFGFTTIFTKYSTTHLIEEIK